VPAYRYGTGARNQTNGEAWDGAESRLQSGWDAAKGESRLAWDKARDAVRDAWDRSDRTYKTYDASDRYYEQRFNQADYYKADYSFDDYKPAYRYGTYARSQSKNAQWDDSTERELERGWDAAKGTSRLAWTDAKGAVKDAWHGVERILPGDADPDGRRWAPRRVGAGGFRPPPRRGQVTRWQDRRGGFPSRLVVGSR